MDKLHDMITLYNDDCLNALKSIPDNSVNLVMTSPPYAMQRKNTYGGIPEHEYSAWFLPIADELRRVLTHAGSFVLNIKEHTSNGQRSTYVLRLVLDLIESGWHWIDEYIWHKTNPMPGRYLNRLKDGYERCLHFAKGERVAIYKDAVKTETHLDISKLDTSEGRVISKNNSGMNWDRSQIIREMVEPSNVISGFCGAVSTGHHTYHPATFPAYLPLFFIKLFTQENDTVLDPFMGSGTTIVEAYKSKRYAIGIELNDEYYEKTRDYIATEFQRMLV